MPSNFRALVVSSLAVVPILAYQGKPTKQKKRSLLARTSCAAAPLATALLARGATAQEVLPLSDITGVQSVHEDVGTLSASLSGLSLEGNESAAEKKFRTDLHQEILDVSSLDASMEGLLQTIATLPTYQPELVALAAGLAPQDKAKILALLSDKDLVGALKALVDAKSRLSPLAKALPRMNELFRVLAGIEDDAESLDKEVKKSLADTEVLKGSLQEYLKADTGPDSLEFKLNELHDGALSLGADAGALYFVVRNTVDLFQTWLHSTIEKRAFDQKAWDAFMDKEKQSRQMWNVSEADVGKFQVQVKAVVDKLIDLAMHDMTHEEEELAKSLGLNFWEESKSSKDTVSMEAKKFFLRQ